MESFLKKVQGSGDETKRKYVFGVSVVVCGLFLFLWVQYFSSITTLSNTAQAEAAVPEGVSFMQSFRAGVADVGHAIGGLFNRAVARIAKPSETEVKPTVVGM